MKNLSTLLLLFITVSLSAAPGRNIDSTLLRQIDSTHYALLKPRVTAYLEKADRLIASINSATDKATQRRYGRQLAHLTDSLIAAADIIYEYCRHTGTQMSYAYVLSSGAYEYVMVPYTSITGTEPSVRDALENIKAHAQSVGWWPFTTEGQLTDIKEALSTLRKF